MHPSVLILVFIHISHLIFQMIDISHESETPWVGCVRGIDQREVNQLNIIMVGQKHNKVQQAYPYHNGGAEAPEGLASLAP